MESLKIFKSDDFGSIRVLYEDGKPLFCGADACKALGYSKKGENNDQRRT